MFSIVIPLYNKERSITNTIQSVLAQTFQDFEIIVVNDGSSDGSVKKVEFFTDPRIQIVHQENAGVSSARNRGVKVAKFDWIAFLDSDDIWLENHLEILNKNINKYKLQSVFCNSFVKSDNFVSNQDDYDEVTIVEDYFREAIKKHFLWTSAIALRKEVFSDVGFFDTRLSRGEDLDVWIRVGRKYEIVRSNQITAIYNQEAENKATHKRSSLKKSVVSFLNFEEANYTERTYYKKLICDKIKEEITYFNFCNATILLCKYNLKLII